MARYTYIDTNPRFLVVDLAKQLLPGTFEHAVDHLLEHAIDLSGFDARFRNDGTGATAYPPSMLLPVVLCAYAHGIVSSRGIERACREHVTFIALCGDTAPHFTTIAHFISTRGDDIARVVAGVLAVCDQQGLIGREMFAIDGVKLPSNASKRRSGTRAEFAQQATKLEAAVETMLARHRAADGAPTEPTLLAKEQQRIAALAKDATQIREWLATHQMDRHGPSLSGGLRKSNRTDNESAKMATGKGVVQGYTGVVAVDAKTQIIVEAQAHGTGSEPECLLPVVTAITPPTVQPSDFTYDPVARTCVCPAGKSLSRTGQQLATKGHIADRFRGAQRDCGPCPLRAQCLRTPEKTKTRQVAFFTGKTPERIDSHTARMQRRIDTPMDRARYARRFAVVEPVFGNLRYNTGLDRFTLRGRVKVDGQWKRVCLVQNIEKLAHHGYAA